MNDWALYLLFFFGFSNDNTKICNECESKNQDIENLENEVKEMKMKLEIKGSMGFSEL